jgi:hypothetical protein
MFPNTISHLSDDSTLEIEDNQLEFKNDHYRYYLKVRFSEHPFHAQKIEAIYYQKSHQLYIYFHKMHDTL